jgi:hypothetical protein
MHPTEATASHTLLRSSLVALLHVSYSTTGTPEWQPRIAQFGWYTNIARFRVNDRLIGHHIIHLPSTLWHAAQNLYMQRCCRAHPWHCCSCCLGIQESQPRAPS